MIIVRRQRFDVSRRHAQEHPEAAAAAVARGPVLAIGLTFERWLGGRRVEADAFVDPGADQTCISLRWVKEQGGTGKHSKPRMTLPDPELRDHFLLDEGLNVELGGHALALGAPAGVRIMEQPPMAGFEDVLLGRDFLREHGLMLILDAQDEEFSILLPADDENRRRRADILAALSPLDEHAQGRATAPR